MTRQRSGAKKTISGAKTHKNDPLKPGIGARLVASTFLTRVIDDGRNIDALSDHQGGLDAYLNLDPKDRALARAIAITALRNRNAINQCLSKMWKRPPPKRARFLHHMLHVAAAQILFMDLPDRAAVDLAVSAIGDDQRTTRFRSLANAVLRRMVREKDKLKEEISAGISPFPGWFEKQLRKDFGRDRLTEITRAVSVEGLVDLTVKSDPETWAEKLGGIVLPTGSVRLTNSAPVETLEGFVDGEWWVQDAAAAIPARLLNTGPGMEVLELCAAPGGKTAQLSNSGCKVTALDISAVRLKRLEHNLKRLKLSATLVEADILKWEPEKQFDAVLLDAPCSSTGTIRRHPDVLWTRSASSVSELAELQFRLVEKARSFVKPGGQIVFSNCSIFKMEGEDLIPRITKQCDDLSLSEIKANEIAGLETAINGQGALRTLPSHMRVKGDDGLENLRLSGMDGFFAVRFDRKPV